jgi:alginate O-acetyltransferase complex protein AlgI
MLISFNNLIIFTLILLSFFWSFFSAAKYNFIYKKILLISASSLIIFVYNPLILILLIFFSVYCFCCYQVAAHFKNPIFLWAIFIPLLISNFISFGNINLPSKFFGNQLSILSENTFYLGFSYYSIKSFGSLKFFLKEKKFNLLDFVVSNIFFPSFVSGPIDYANKFSNNALNKNFNIEIFISGILRLGVGLIKIIILNKLIFSLLSSMLFFEEFKSLQVNWYEMNALFSIKYTLFCFLVLYINFSAFTDIAIGIGRMFHLELSENFNFPLLSNSIQNFWQRWHLSLSNFINQNIFIPLYRKTGNFYISIYCTFLFAGLWHKISFGYFLWGFLHGSALILYYKCIKNNQLIPNSKILNVISIFLTIFFVSFVSLIANLGDKNTILVFLNTFVKI